MSTKEFYVLYDAAWRDGKVVITSCNIPIDHIHVVFESPTTDFEIVVYIKSGATVGDILNSVIPKLEFLYLKACIAERDTYIQNGNQIQ